MVENEVRVVLRPPPLGLFTRPSTIWVTRWTCTGLGWAVGLIMKGSAPKKSRTKASNKDILFSYFSLSHFLNRLKLSAVVAFLCAYKLKAGLAMAFRLFSLMFRRLLILILSIFKSISMQLVLKKRSDLKNWVESFFNSILTQFWFNFGPISADFDPILAHFRPDFDPILV